MRYFRNISISISIIFSGYLDIDIMRLFSRYTTLYFRDIWISMSRMYGDIIVSCIMQYIAIENINFVYRVSYIA